jgi:hypothetical protein
MNQTIFLDLVLGAGTMVLILAFVIYRVWKNDWITHRGRRIIATITSICHETGKTQKGWTRDNYYVTAQWTSPKTGETYTFWTWILWRHPGYEPGNLVPVLINPHNPKQYVMEM